MTPGESAGPDAMLAARAVVAAGSWSPPPIDVVTLDYDARYRRRITLTCGSGRQVLLDLPRAQLLNHGDGLATEAGVIEVRAADEELAAGAVPVGRSGLGSVGGVGGDAHGPAMIAGARAGPAP